MKQFYDDAGIIHKTSCIETPQQNVIVEMKHQQLLNVTRSLLFQSNLPNIFWSYAFNHAIVLINCMPFPFLDNKTPFEKLHGTIYDNESLKVFGCLCFSSTLEANRRKLEPRTVTSVFLGLKPNTKGFVTSDHKTRSIFVSRNVIFYEDCFPFIDQGKPNVVIVLPTPSSHYIDQFDESLTDYSMHVCNDNNFDPSTSKQPT